MKWYEEENNNYKGVIISSRVRLARNLSNYCFPDRITKEKSNQLIDEIKNAFLSIENSTNFNDINMNNVLQMDKIAMMERHIISPLFMDIKRPTRLILSKDESISIMINEEDHVRIQSMKSGMNLISALENANKVDDLLEKKLSYAFDYKLGYLTACPTNIGTGLRASYMIHVPALEKTGQLKLLLEAVGKFGLTVRGIYGEGSEAQGSVFQISNQVTLGANEEEIINNLTTLTKQILEQELIVRDKYLNERKIEFEDLVYRSYGILSNARVISSKEAMTLLSDIKLGFELGILNTNTDKKLNIFDLMTCIQPANLQKIEKKTLSIEGRNIARANYIRENLPQLL